MRLIAKSSHFSRAERRWLLWAILLCIALALPSITHIKTTLIHWGYVALHQHSAEKASQLARDVAQAPIRWLQAERQLPVLRLDIAYQDWQKLADDRTQALEAGMIPDNRQQVKAKLYVDSRAIDASVRLQGDLLDHVNGATRWSLKVELKKKQALFSARRFALVSPHVRIHQGPVLFAETLRLAGFDIVSPQYKPVRVYINGSDWGVMFFEQAFSQDLIATNFRTEGVIVRLDNPENHQIEGAIHRVLRPRVLQQNSVLGNVSLGYQRQIALALISDFIDGRRPASEVFDVEKLGQYLATADLWGAWHALAWNNWRWYYNPHTARLEPIQSDVAISPAAHFMLMRRPTDSLLISRQMLSDPAVKAQYDIALSKLEALVLSSDLPHHLDNVQATLLSALDGTAPLTPSFDTGLLHRQMTCLKLDYQAGVCETIPLLSDTLHTPMVAMRAGLVWDLQAQFIGGAQPQLQVHNSEHVPLTLKRLEGTTEINEITTLPEANSVLPLQLMPGERIAIPLPRQVKHIELRASLGNGKSAQYRFIKGVSALHFIPRPAEYQALALGYEFIEKGEGYWRFPAGEWQLNDYLVTPNHWQVILEPGTILTFGPKAGLMVFGSLQASGRDDAPVLMKSVSPHQTWAGLTVFATAQSEPTHITHLAVTHAASPKLGLWQPRGATYLVGGDLTINGLSLADNQAEDALNIVNSEVFIENLSIRNALSDAFDCDFCRGQIKGGLFENIGARSGGDGIDVSGSNLQVSDVRFVDVRDKAVSVGEDSRMELENIELERVSFGLVGKDASVVSAKRVVANDVTHYALMSYSKKPLFGGGTMVVEAYQCPQCDKEKVIAETGSELTVNGAQILPQPLDVNALYNTLMKPDKPL